MTVENDKVIAFIYTNLSHEFLLSFVWMKFLRFRETVIWHELRRHKSSSLGMPRHPKLLSKNEQPTKLGDAPEWHPRFLPTTIGNFTWSYIFIHHMICVLLGASCMILVFSCFILCFKSSILAGHTYLREPKLCHDLLELLSLLFLNLLWARTCSSTSLKCFRARRWICFIETIDLSCFT